MQNWFSAHTILQTERVQYNMTMYKTYWRYTTTTKPLATTNPVNQHWDTCCALDKSSLDRTNNLQKSVSCLVDEGVGPKALPEPYAHVHAHTLHIYTPKNKNKSKAFWLLLSGHIYPVTSTALLRYCESAPANPPGAGLVTYRWQYHVSQVRVWAPKVPPGSSPTMQDMCSWHLHIHTH